MPSLPNRPCREPRCPAFAVERRRCASHAAVEAERVRAYDRARNRDWARQFERSREWIKTRDAYRQAHPVCGVASCGMPTEAVDHVVGLRQGGAPLDWDNLAAYCARHHAQKGAKSGELFGRSVR